MSNVQPMCEKCSIAMDCERVAWFVPSLRSTFAVSWVCPTCTTRTLVVSPLGPEHITSTGCVHCGSEDCSDVDPCLHCGVSLDQVLSAAERELSDDGLLKMASEAFGLGTCRRALSIANYVLRRSSTGAEAQAMKEQFVEQLDSVSAFS